MDGRSSTAALDAHLAPRPATLILCSGVRIHRDSLAAALAEVPDVVLLETFPSASEAARQLSVLRPDVVVIDASILDASIAVSTLLAVAPGVRTVAIVTRNEPHVVVSCAAAGVAGLVAGDSSVDDLVTVILGTRTGGFACSPGIAPLLGLGAAPAMPPRRRPRLSEQLTRRELEIVHLIDQGLSNKQIARALSIEVSTTKNHVHHILKKLGVERRTAAIAAVRGA